MLPVINTIVTLALSLVISQATFTVNEDGSYQIVGTQYGGCLPTTDHYYSSLCTYGTDGKTRFDQNVKIFTDGEVIATFDGVQYTGYVATLDTTKTVTAYTYTTTADQACTVTNSTGHTTLYNSNGDAWCSYPVTPGEAYTVTVMDQYNQPVSLTFTAEDHAQEYNPL